MNKKLETIIEIGSGVVAIAFIGLIIFAFYAAINVCSLSVAKPKSAYTASYGTFTSRSYYEFETYDYSSGRYILYDKNHKVVADILVTGNNQFEIKTNR